MMLPEAAAAATSCSWLIGTTEFVDGSQQMIVNPVVVSNLFWSNLQSTLVVLIVGQAITTVVFLLALVVFANQFATWTAQLDRLFGEESSKKKKKKKPLRIPSELRDSTARSTPPRPDVSKLVICLAIDLIGTSSEFIPFVGELSDVVWAPVAALLLRRLFGNNNILAVLEFTEELLPFTDLLPLATIGWVVDTYARDTIVAQLLGLGNYRRRRQEQEALSSSRTERHREEP